MSDGFFISIRKIIFFIIIFTIIICFLFIPIIYNSNYNNIYLYSDSFLISNFEYLWPIPGYTTITSYFGKRNSPITGASSYHSGIDIGAPEGTSFIAVTSRKNYIYRILRRWRIYNNTNKWNL